MNSKVDGVYHLIVEIAYRPHNFVIIMRYLIYVVVGVPVFIYYTLLSAYDDWRLSCR